MGNRSYFVEKWTESYDILTTAAKTRNTGQCFFALVRMFVQAAATLTLILPLISVYKGWSQATHKIDMTYNDHVRDQSDFNGSTLSLEDCQKQLAEGKGILDRAYAERRFGFISDCTGHAKPVDFQSCKNYSNMTLFESFAKDFIYQSLNALKLTSIDLLKTDLQKVVLKELDDKALYLGLGGTFHMAYIAEVNHKKVVITVDAGDSTLWLVRGKEVQKLSQQNDERKSLGSMNTSDGCSFRVFEVQEGDRIVGMTDFTDFLPEDEVKKMIAEKSTAHDIVLEFKKLLGSEGEVLEKGQKKHDPSDLTKSDDMGVFALTV